MIKDLSQLISKICEVGQQLGLKININKTKTSVGNKTPKSPIDDQHIEHLTSNVYIGSLYWEWEIRKGDQQKNDDITDHIHQH